MIDDIKIYDSFDEFVAEKYSGSLFGKLLNIAGAPVPELKKYSKMLEKAIDELVGDHNIFVHLAVQDYLNRTVSAKQEFYNRLQEFYDKELKNTYAVLKATDEICDTVTDIKVLHGARTNVKSAFKVLKERLLVEKVEDVILQTVSDPEYANTTAANSDGYHAHWGYINSNDSSLRTAQTNTILALQNLKRIFDRKHD